MGETMGTDSGPSNGQMRVIHVVPAVAEEASGPSYSVVRLCQSLIDVGEELTLAAMDVNALVARPAFLKVFPVGIGPLRAGRSPKMRRWLADETRDGSVDVLHSHGMWQMNAVYPGWVTSRGNTRLVISPRGAFSAWAMNHGSRFKRVFWPLVQRPALERASCFHAATDTEYEDIRRLGFKQPVTVIPNGVDVPPPSHTEAADARTLLFLGRIHPTKGVDILLHAWSEVMGRFPAWRLLIVGTDTAYGVQGRYLEAMRELVRTLKLERVEFTGAAYGEAKWAAYHEAELFVLPTRSDSFGMTVAEALAAGTPAVVSKGAPWEGLATHEAGWWVDMGTEALTRCLADAMREPPGELARRGSNGRRWMLEDFSWPAIGNRMDQTYQWLVRGGDTPAWVRTN